MQLKREKDMRTWDLDVLLNNLLAQKRKQLYFDCTTDIPVRREPEYKKKLRRTLPTLSTVPALISHRTHDTLHTRHTVKRENELGGYDGDGTTALRTTSVVLARSYSFHLTDRLVQAP